MLNRMISGRLHGVIRAAVKRRAKMENQGATIEQLAPIISGQAGRSMLETGDVSKGLLTVGQVIGLVRDIPTVKELIDRIIKEAEEVASNIGAGGIFKPLRKPVEAVK